MLKHNIKKIDYALLTHAHADHCGGLDNLVEAHDAKLFVPSDVMPKLFTSEDHLAWLKKRNPSIQINNFKPFSIGNFSVDSVRLFHEKLGKIKNVNTPCYGYVFNSKDFSFAYCTDYSEILEPKKLRNLNLFISDGNGMENNGMGHVGVAGSLKFFKELKPKRMILTHISHKQEHHKVENAIKNFTNISVAFDGMEIEC